MSSEEREVRTEYLYRLMVRARKFEEALSSLWRRGFISGELHLGTGEEAVAAGFVSHLENGDALCLDHRSTPPLVCRGLPLEPILLELLGSSKGLCSGWGGHMHLLSKEYLAASSGIVGSSTPLALGFALANKHLRPGKVALCFFGEGAMNQGMVLESLNLACVWKLPVIFVCKDNRWAITTRSRSVTAGSLRKRAGAYGMPAWKINGLKVDQVSRYAHRAIERARKGKGPSFILARCSRIDGHFLGDPLFRIFEEPLDQVKTITPPLVSSALAKPGATIPLRARALGCIGKAIALAGADRANRFNDPLWVSGRLVAEEKRVEIEAQVSDEIESAVRKSLELAGLMKD